MPDTTNLKVNLELQRFAGNRFADIVLRFPCPQRILMVTDGSLSFGTGFFGLSELVAIVSAAGHTVRTAHRSGVAPVTIAGAFNFDTAAVAVTRDNYDQVWLFGYSTAALTPAEQARMNTFMKAGGGVFATGDHQTLGQGMGANLPRVRAMRNWNGIPMSSPTRLDTVLDPGIDKVKQFNDQANAVPQRTYPVWFSNGGSDFDAASWSVHPVLRHATGPIDVMPDHPHESECLAPVPGATTFAGDDEWPAPSGGGARIAPAIVSVSMSSGRFITSGAPTATGTKPPVLPRSFGGISAYDGDAAKVGRIVCDSTWHHFVNINLNGAGAGVDSAGNVFIGLQSAPGVPTADYLRIQAYYLNMVRWLAPANRRSCWPFVLATLARFDPELMELQLPQPHPCPWDPLLVIGRAAEDALIRVWGAGAAAEVVSDLLAAADAPPGWSALLRSRVGQHGDEKRGDASLLPLADLRRALLGSLVNVVALKLPADEAGLEQALKDGHDRIATQFTAEAVQAALPVMRDQIAKQLDRMRTATQGL